MDNTYSYCVSIITTDGQEIEYRDLDGPNRDQVKDGALARFQDEHPDKTVETATCLLAAEYYSLHECRDRDGDDCCDQCGAVMPGTALDRRLHGGD